MKIFKQLDASRIISVQMVFTAAVVTVHQVTEELLILFYYEKGKKNNIFICV